MKELLMTMLLRTAPCFLVLSLLIAIGCGGDAVHRPAIPDTPDGTVRVVLDGLVQHRPEVAWRALPPSYQQDVTDLTRGFADTVDPVVFDRAVAVARKGAVVLQGKKDLILGSESFARSPIDPASLDSYWEASVHMLDAVLASEASDLQTLRELDVEAWLAGTGSALMDQASLLPTVYDGMESLTRRIAAFEHAEVELVGETGESAVVMVTAPQEAAVELELVRVEGRWIPVDLASQWPRAVAEAEAKIRSLDGDDDSAAQLRVQMLLGIGIVEGFIDQIDRMETSDELDSLIGGVLGNIMATQDRQPATEG